MAEKTLNTRIQLRYDSYENWMKDNSLELKKGEIAVAYLGPTQTTTNPDNETHPVLFKVGPGLFKNLPWASALAADVYDWAKAATKPEYQASEIKGLAEYIGGRVQDTDLDTRYNFEVTSAGKLKVTKTLYTLGVAGDTTEVGEYDFITPSELDDYYTKSQVDALIQDAKDYADENDTNTAHTHIKGSGTKVTASGGVSGEVAVNLNVALELANNQIKLYDKDDTSKTALATLDASSFIKDGMLDDVSYNASTNTLTFTWNTAAGSKTDTVVLSDILDPYVFTEGAKIDIATDGTKVTISHEAINNPTESTGSGRKYLTGITTDGYGHITGFTTASETDQDLSNYQPKGDYKTKQTAVSNPTANGSALAFIDSISQNANGVITVTKKNVNLDDYVKKIDDKDTTYTAKTNGGLKLEGTEFSIDDSLTFVFDCGDAFGNPLN